MNDSQLTVEDFARVPWGGMAVLENGLRAVRIPGNENDENCWRVRHSDSGSSWCTDVEMSAVSGWRILPTATTSLEALDAAWELGYEPEGGVIPAGSMYLFRSPNGSMSVHSSADGDLQAIDVLRERRLMEPPEPKLEPWETSPYVIATTEEGEIVVLQQVGSLMCAPSWRGHGLSSLMSRDEVAAMSPRPLDLNGEV